MNTEANSILRIEELVVHFGRREERVAVINGINLNLNKGRVLGLVGESGCGKSVTSLAIMGLLAPDDSEIGGKIIFDGQELTSLSREQMAKIRGNSIAMVFQEPMTSLNPVFTIGYQIGEVLSLHQGITGEENRKHCIELLRSVNIPDSERIYQYYPHKLSGGMRQRVMIAMAMACRPKLIIADEPTTALDVTIQAQILDLFKELGEKQGTSMIFISHDLGVIAEIADDVAVMYAGYIMEECTAVELYDNPLHPYTFGLMNARRGSSDQGKTRLYCIPGIVPSPYDVVSGCPFVPRCICAAAVCHCKLPALREVKPGHKVRCWEVENHIAAVD